MLFGERIVAGGWDPPHMKAGTKFGESACCCLTSRLSVAVMPLQQCQTASRKPVLAALASAREERGPRRVFAWRRKPSRTGHARDHSLAANGRPVRVDGPSDPRGWARSRSHHHHAYHTRRRQRRRGATQRLTQGLIAPRQ
jgi:hypothetical protein